MYQKTNKIYIVYINIYLEIYDQLRFDIWDLGVSSVTQGAVLCFPMFYMFSPCCRDAQRIKLLNVVCVIIALLSLEEFLSQWLTLLFFSSLSFCLAG